MEETDMALFERFLAFPPCGDVGELETALTELRGRKIAHFKPEKTTRKCLKCDLEFLSEGPHNRVCDRCRKENGKLTAGAIPCFHGLGEVDL